VSLLDDIVFSLHPRCPVCRKGRLFKPWSIAVNDKCPECGADLGAHDVGDGASVFLIFLLGVTLVPSALVVDHVFSPPLWVHMIIWTAVGLGIMALVLPTVKAYIILLEFRHRRGGGGA
jgi:uncharacterized protein (DUF983 family)